MAGVADAKTAKDVRDEDREAAADDSEAAVAASEVAVAASEADDGNTNKTYRLWNGSK